MSIIDKYQAWVRANAQAASQIEQTVRIGVFFMMDPSSLLAVEAGYTAANVIGLVHETSHVPDAVRATEAHKMHLALRVLREAQCVGELLVRRFLMGGGAGAAARSLSYCPRYGVDGGTASRLPLQVYIAAVEALKALVKLRLFGDVWRSAWPEMIRLPSWWPGRGSNAALAADATTTSDIRRSSNGASIPLPHVLLAPEDEAPSGPTPPSASGAVVARRPLELSRADRVGLWIDLLDTLRPIVACLALVPLWHRRRALHRAWALWLAGLAYELVAAVLTATVARGRSAVLRADGSLVQQLQDRSRQFLLGCHMLRYPFFNTMIEPGVRGNILAGTSIVARIPLFGGMIQAWLSYLVEMQKRSILFSSGA